MSTLDENIKSTLLYHLRKKRVMSGVHTHYDTLKKGFPKHLGKDIEKIADKLIRDGWLLAKSTNYGLQVSLNKEKLQEIEAFVEKVMGYKFE